MAKTKKKKTFNLVLGTIGDIVFIPIFIVALFVCIAVLFDKSGSKVPSIFGYSLVKIQSKSMAATGFFVGDSVILKETDNHNLKIGTIISFYMYEDEADDDIEKILMEDENEIIFATEPAPANRLTIQDLRDRKKSVFFHQIINIYYDATGVKYYQTKGSSNAAPDTVLVREDFVVGKYIETSRELRDIIIWVTKPMGMIFCVCIPLGILVILESLALIEQCSFMIVERKLMRGDLDWQDREAQRLIQTGEMEEIVKIIHFAKVDEDERDEYCEQVWPTKPKMSKRMIKYMKLVEDGKDIFVESGYKEYLLYWKKHAQNGWDRKQIEQEIYYSAISKALD